FSSRRRHTRSKRDWSSDVCSSDLSGTNAFHGSVWEFFRNDKLDAADYFERDILPNGSTRTRKGELRLNQYGFSVGGPVIKNRIFFFGDYEGLRRRQGVPHNGAVPTVAERNSGYTNLQELITAQSGTQQDALGRILPVGTVLDTATTRETSIGSGVFVRDPFSNAACANAPPGFTYTLAACDLN